jgi:hypothetical protein
LPSWFDHTSKINKSQQASSPSCLYDGSYLIYVISVCLRVLLFYPALVLLV